MRRSTTTILLLALIALVTLAGSSRAATHEHVREGFLLGFNLGGGSAQGQVEGDGFEVSTDDRVGGVGVGLRLGYAVRPDLVLGVESGGWGRQEDVILFGSEVTTTTTVVVSALAATWYPGEGGFFLRGGIGVGTYTETAELGNLEAEVSDSGLGLLLALGYEWRLGTRFALGPQLDFGYVNLGEVDVVDLDGNQGTADLSFDYAILTLVFNWYL